MVSTSQIECGGMEEPVHCSAGRFQIRKADRQDLGQILDILQGLSNYYPIGQSQDDLWKRFSSQGGVYPYVVSSDRLVVGYAVLIIVHNIRGGALAQIEDVVVSEAYRGCGLGASLISALKLFAKSRGCYKVCLHSNPKNSEFYESCGFIEVGHSFEARFY
jgi:N-acetylglutamate synthase-like GNAT family acetyltransferase